MRPSGYEMPGDETVRVQVRRSEGLWAELVLKMYRRVGGHADCEGFVDTDGANG